MNRKTASTGKKGASFTVIYMIGVIFATTKLIDYLQWTFQLIKKWDLPDEPFFSKVVLMNNTVEISTTAYLVFALAYILVFGFIILGLYQLNRTTKLFEGNSVFQPEVSVSFKRAGKSFLAFAFGTFIIDVAFLAWAHTSSRVMDLLSTELLVFLILGYLMFFLADVFKEGITLQEENDLII
ncbi:Protein of unknown function [Algoriphagus locisalis]|uniref:DUF2975 domain-containing protein n=1 Tax=Algoriphagus locisalis TaxID=305507 RepID=A0A1I7E4I3_9BACT|nr:DUF2975 domain-containing protein [Algoriphagus locisalis]SFU18836.1 Protein of unknown function [Algoriphagus locisalis]